MFKGKLCLVLLVFSLLVLCSTLSLAREDPELRQCKHQCRHQRQFDSKQQERCESSCEDYVREKERLQREREMGKSREDEWEGSNPSHDPERQYRKCRERCQEKEEGRREQQVCESRCEERRQEQERRGGRVESDDVEEFTKRREQMRGGEEEEEESESSGSGKPYVFQDEHFTTHIKTQEGRVRVLEKFTERSKLFKGIENYRVLIFEANPQTFIVPNHWDADSIFFVAQGRGTINLVFTDRRDTFNLEQGHVMVIPAGVTVYLINNDNNEKLVLVKLVSSVTNPGKFTSFFGPGGQDPESFFNAFSSELLEAAFKTPRDRLQRIFSQQREGAIIKASEEQIRAMSHQEHSKWPFGGKGSRDFSPFQLLRQRPKESNEFGKLFEANFDDFKLLQDFDLHVSFANITQGSMATPHYNSRATKIAIVLNGRGYFEMACPHVTKSGHRQREHHHGGKSRHGQETPIHYQKINTELRTGTVFVVPAGHPFITVASEDENLEVICFEVNAENNRKFPLAGQKNILKNLEREAKELAFATSADEVDRVFENQQEEFFFPGPRSSQRRGYSII